MLFVDEKSVVTEAQKAGTDSPLVFVYIPRRAHEDLKKTIASLKAEWAKLESPKRLQELATRHLSLRSIEATQYDSLKNLPPRPPSFGGK